MAASRVLRDNRSETGGLPAAGSIRSEFLAVPQVLREQRQHNRQLPASLQRAEVGGQQRAGHSHKAAPALAFRVLRLPHLLGPRHA